MSQDAQSYGEDQMGKTMPVGYGASGDVAPVQRAARSHEVELVSDFLTPGWRAECSCGWVSPQRDESGQAQRDFRVHLHELSAPVIDEPDAR